MFTFSFNWLRRLNGKNLDLDKVINILNLQGLEVKKVTDFEEDKVVTIEVKANRPDALYHTGILREITAFNGELPPLKIEPKLSLKNDNTKFKIDIENSDICKRFSSLIIRGIKIKTETPDYIKKSLEALSINTINPVIDIVNYVMLELGQPMHAYDVNKISGNTIRVMKNKKRQKLMTLDGSETEIPEGPIVIVDNEKILSIAGIIGGIDSAITEDSYDILLESANFNEVDVRLASRALKISTPSSFRFERGIDVSGSLYAMMICADMIVEICGGVVDEVYFDQHSEYKKNILKLRKTKTNDILGTNLSLEEIIACLNKYYFKCEIYDDETIKVEIPSYRLDLLREIDLIEEVARIYGYHNIEPTMPVIKATYVKNSMWENMDKIRDIMSGIGFYEMINYSFIPANSMEILNISEDSQLYSDIILKNPISQYYALMRPTLIYSLLGNITYNITKDNRNLALYEIGRTYFRDDSADTGFKEEDVIGIIFTGVRIEKGWGILNDVKYSFYDISNYLNIIFDEFGMSYEEGKNSMPFFKEDTGVDIKVNGRNIGFYGQIDPELINKVPNGKLIQNDVMYIEINLKYVEKKNKSIKYDSKYQAITREYNFLVSKNLLVSNIIAEIKSVSNLIQKVVVRDLYDGKGIPQGRHSILLQLKYLSTQNTLSAEEVTEIENKFLDILKTKWDVSLKDA
ncbi:phenylalanyl-tRNA synthetase beta subunit [Anaerobacterium chartisolvens]|uniref:Phenylalanine--tRNA ligase beta subunit n=1 Tax=Anaerobacterium chartisolvens TaxID=1297424 RepID=A0A369BHH3_9FIRM|nr:phenylalanine--tRNA ligase subunit beta [Anaerobacterium chartisolvens]RCX21012.1 phenylalanyl-tRNA synthetase beta subunit [Anaerobacterium chartisolvens]